MVLTSKKRKIIVGSFFLIGAVSIALYLLFVVPQKERGFTYKTEDEALKVLATSPNNPVALRSMVIYRGYANDKKGELDYLRKLIKADPTDNTFKYRMAVRLIKTHRQDETKEGTEILRELSKDSSVIATAARRELRRIDTN